MLLHLCQKVSQRRPAVVGLVDDENAMRGEPACVIMLLACSHGMHAWTHELPQGPVIGLYGLASSS